MADILLVDDEPDVRESIGQVLRAAGHQVRAAHDGPSGLRALQERVPDLVIADLVMPNVHGIELIVQVRREQPALPILAISGGGNFWPDRYQPESVHTSSYLAAAEKLGASASLSKPFNRRTLLEAVDGLLAGGALPAS